jgi:oligopeptide/dipeptide ABC transporter ATP-binding protein
LIDMTLLQIDNLSVRYRRLSTLEALLTPLQPKFRRALREVSMSLCAGETLGLIGESGSGKSTLGRTVMGLERAFAGSIRFEGRELVGLSERNYRGIRRDIAMIFQDPVASLSPRMKISELLVEPLLIHGIGGPSRQGRAAELLGAVGLSPRLLAAHPHELSGGEARRVGIARALALDPKVIIADEPTAGLDVSVQGEVISLLNRLQQQRQIAYLFITHNLSVARHACDRLAILYQGAICEMGPASEVLERPAHPYTELLLRSTPHLNPLQPRDMVEASELQAPSGHGCPFEPSCRRAVAECRTVFPEVSTLNGSRQIRCHRPIHAKYT